MRSQAVRDSYIISILVSRAWRRVQRRRDIERRDLGADQLQRTVQVIAETQLSRAHTESHSESPSVIHASARAFANP